MIHSGHQEDAIRRGAVVVNGKPVADPSTVVKNGDLISHTLHRHEPPVTGEAIGIIHEDEDMMVINKPAGVPVHPTGRYNFNSLVEIIRAERGLGFNPCPANRLDRLTSGVMFMGKHPRGAEVMSRQISSRTVTKEYVARVKGEFPPGEVVCSQPILLISPKLGLNRVRADGKEAETVFTRQAYYANPQGRRQHHHHLQYLHQNQPQQPQQEEEEEEEEEDHPSQDAYSIVHCRPITGRTHQIRVHLQFLGHPIANDPIYCNQRVFGPQLGFNDDSASADEDIIARLSRMGKDEVAEAVAYHDEIRDRYEKKKAEKMSGESCEVCQTPLYSEPGPHELGIFLHASRYACQLGRWHFESPLPVWARPSPLELSSSSSSPTDIVGPIDGE